MKHKPRLLCSELFSQIRNFINEARDSQHYTKIAPVAVISKHSSDCWIFTSSCFISGSRSDTAILFTRYSTVSFHDFSFIFAAMCLCYVELWVFDAQLYHAQSTVHHHGNPGLKRFSCNTLSGSLTALHVREWASTAERLWSSLVQCTTTTLKLVHISKPCLCLLRIYGCHTHTQKWHVLCYTVESLITDTLINEHLQ
jgi:hypothetical protein